MHNLGLNSCVINLGKLIQLKQMRLFFLVGLFLF